MLELQTLNQLLQKLPMYYLGIGAIFFSLLLTKKNFTQPENIPNKSHTLVYTLFFAIFAIIPTIYFGWGFYQVFNPDFKYDTVSSQVNFHIFQPTYLPPKIRQATTYQIIDDPRFDSSPTVRVHFNKNIQAMVEDTDTQVIVVDQSQPPKPFSLGEYLTQQSSTKSEKPNVKPITLSQFPNAQVFLESNSFLSTLWLYTNDGVLIRIISPTIKTPTEELIKIAESLH